MIVIAIIAAVSLTFGGRTNRPSNAGSDILAQSTITKTNSEDENDDADISNLILDQAHTRLEQISQPVLMTV